jgi:hypothetical protein
MRSLTIYFVKAKEWIELFTSLKTGYIHKGYSRAAVTPYIGRVEKNNDVARSVVLRKSQQHPASDVLQLESRQWELRGSQRTKRVYNKKDRNYREVEIRNKRIKDS